MPCKYDCWLFLVSHIGVTLTLLFRAVWPNNLPNCLMHSGVVIDAGCPKWWTGKQSQKVLLTAVKRGVDVRLLARVCDTLAETPLDTSTGRTVGPKCQAMVVTFAINRMTWNNLQYFACLSLIFRSQTRALDLLAAYRFYAANRYVLKTEHRFKIMNPV